MKKTTLALMLLTTLGLSACSSGGSDSSSNNSPTTNAQVAALQAQLATAQSAQATAQASAESALKTAKEAQTAQKTAETALATAQAELKAAQEALANAGSTSDTEVAKLKSDLATAQANLAKATTEAQTAQKAAETAQAELKTAQESLSNTKLTTSAEIETLKSELTTAQSELTKATEETQAALKTATDAQAAQKAAESALAAAQDKLKELQARLDAIEAAEKQAEVEAKVDSVVNNLTSGYGTDTSSQTYAYLSDSAKKALLAETIANDSSKCKATTGTTCIKNAVAGDILFSQKQAYSSYAVLRENADSATQPVNSYVAVVDTATKDKNLVLDATYKGSALFTTKNQNTYTGYTAKTGSITDLTLSVSDQGVVSGDIKYTTGKQPTLVTFNNAEIQVGQNGVVFEGSATFDAKNLALTGSKDTDGNYVNPTGTYKGQFAGTNGEEVVGTFSTDSTDKDVSVQGAFMGTKQP